MEHGRKKSKGKKNQSSLWIEGRCSYEQWDQFKNKDFKRHSDFLLRLLPLTLQMQYVFIYQALLEHYLYGDTELEVTSLEIHLQKIYNKVPGTSSNGLEEEFKVSIAIVLLDLLGWCRGFYVLTWHCVVLKPPLLCSLPCRSSLQSKSRMTR